MQQLITSIVSALLHVVATPADHLVFTLDRQQRFTSIFGRPLEAWGMRPADCLGLTPAEVLGERVAQAHETAHARALAGESVDYTWEMAGGECVEVTITPLRTDRGEIDGVVGVGRVRRQEEAIRPRREPLQRLPADLTGFAAQTGLSMEHARQWEQVRLQSRALSAIARAVMITTRQGLIEWVNPAFTALTGYTAEEAIGQTPRILKSGQQSEAFYRKLWEQILSGHVWQGFVRNKRKDGSLYVEEMTITPFRDPSGEISHFVAIKQDITERRREQERMEHMASHDPLTGLVNRRALEQRLRKAVEAAHADLTRSALVMIDLDRFKPVNDTAGHMAGDQCLVELAQVMAGVVRGDDNIARLGGDEFGAVLEGVDEEQAREVAERLRAAVDSFRFHFREYTFSVSASMGIAMIDGTVPAEQVLARADMALYAAKQGGRNRVELWQGDDPLVEADPGTGNNQ